jgi:hypothetical protein
LEVFVVVLGVVAKVLWVSLLHIREGRDFDEKNSRWNRIDVAVD